MAVEYRAGLYFLCPSPGVGCLPGTGNVVSGNHGPGSGGAAAGSLLWRTLASPGGSPPRRLRPICLQRKPPQVPPDAADRGESPFLLLCNVTSPTARCTAPTVCLQAFQNGRTLVGNGFAAGAQQSCPGAAGSASRSRAERGLQRCLGQLLSPKPVSEGSSCVCGTAGIPRRSRRSTSSSSKIYLAYTAAHPAGSGQCAELCVHRCRTPWDRRLASPHIPSHVPHCSPPLPAPHSPVLCVYSFAFSRICCVAFKVWLLPPSSVHLKFTRVVA